MCVCIVLSKPGFDANRTGKQHTTIMSQNAGLVDRWNTVRCVDVVIKKNMISEHDQLI